MSDTPKKDAKAVEKKPSDKKKTSFFQKVGKFFREHRAELRKISWPTFKEVVRNTCITLFVILIIGAIIWLVDWGVSALRDNLIVGDKEAIASSSDIKLTEEELQALLEQYAASNGDLVSGADALVSDANVQ